MKLLSVWGKGFGTDIQNIKRGGEKKNGGGARYEICKHWLETYQSPQKAAVIVIHTTTLQSPLSHQKVHKVFH